MGLVDTHTTHTTHDKHHQRNIARCEEIGRWVLKLEGDERVGELSKPCLEEVGQIVRVERVQGVSVTLELGLDVVGSLRISLHPVVEAVIVESAYARVEDSEGSRGMVTDLKMPSAEWPLSLRTPSQRCTMI